MSLLLQAVGWNLEVLSIKRTLHCQDIHLRRSLLFYLVFYLQHSQLLLQIIYTYLWNKKNGVHSRGLKLYIVKIQGLGVVHRRQKSFFFSLSKCQEIGHSDALSLELMLFLSSASMPPFDLENTKLISWSHNSSVTVTSWAVATSSRASLEQQLQQSASSLK